MPSVPSTKNLKKNVDAADVVNSITSTLDTGVAIPQVLKAGQRMATGGIASKEISLQTLRDVGETIVNYQPLSNAFLSALINRIGRVIITSRLYRNPWADFKKGMVEYGESVEEIFVNIMEAQDFDPARAEKDVFKIEKPDVRSAFHILNYQKLYPVTVTNDELRQAFLSFDGISNLIGKIVEALYTSAAFDEFLVMRYLIARKAIEGNMYPVNIPTLSAANSNGIVTIMKTISDDITELASDYNAAGVYNHTSKDRQYFIMTNAYANVIDVESLAYAFNLTKIELMGRIIRTKSFGFSPQEVERLNALLGERNPNYVPIDDAMNDEFKNIPAVCIDRDFLMIFDNYTNMTEQYNAKGLYWNYFYHQWKTFSTSPFANAIVFTYDTPAINSVTVTPATATASPRSLITFNVDVDVDGFANGQVKWEISGNTSSNTIIDQQGRVTVALDETGPTITVTATSWTDQTKSGTAEITIV